MLDEFFLKKGTEAFLKGNLLLLEAAVPQANPRLANSTVESFPLAIHMTLKDMQHESLMVSPDGWFWEGDGTAGEVVSLNCETNLGASVVLMVFFEQYLRYWVGTIIPHGAPMDMGKVAQHLGEGSRNYQLFNEILKFFLMIRDGVLDENATEIREYAQQVLTWISGRN